MKKSMRFWGMAVPLLLWRLYLCWQAPVETSDLYRNLGYASQLPSWGFHIYETTAAQFEPQFWTSFWTYQGYVYPPAALVFFSLFAVPGLGLFWVKLALTLCDLGSALLLRKKLGPACALLFLAAPVHLWYTSHEGQFESLQTFLLILSLSWAEEKKWFRAAVGWIMAVQLKHFAIVLVPYWLYEFLSTDKIERPRFLLLSAAGLGAGILPFVGFYLTSPDLWLVPLRNQALLFNPFYWNPWSPAHTGWAAGSLVLWNSLLSYAMLGIPLAIFLRRRTGAAALTSAPLAGFLAGLKILNWAQFWYYLIVPALLLPLRNHKRLVVLLFVLYLVAEGRSLALVAGRPLWGVAELPSTVAHFRACLWTCDYSSP